jgi:hypothetical protein
MLFTCMLCGMTGFALFAEAPSAAIFVVGIPFLSFWGLVSPAMQSFMMLAWNRYSALRGLRHADRRCRLTRKNGTKSQMRRPRLWRGKLAICSAVEGSQGLDGSP